MTFAQLEIRNQKPEISTNALNLSTNQPINLSTKRNRAKRNLKFEFLRQARAVPNSFEQCRAEQKSVKSEI